jgi:hypothetical protein
MPEIIAPLPNQEIAREFLAQLKKELSPEASEALEQFRIAQTNLVLNSQNTRQEIRRLQEQYAAYRLSRKNGVPNVLAWATQGEIYAKHCPEQIKPFLSDLVDGVFPQSDMTLRQVVCLLAAFGYNFDQPISHPT